MLCLPHSLSSRAQTKGHLVQGLSRDPEDLFRAPTVLGPSTGASLQPTHLVVVILSLQYVCSSGFTTPRTQYFLPLF